MGMVALSEVLNKILGVNMEAARELREKSQNLQERMQLARFTRDPKEMLELQQESVELYKQLMRKQLLPSCIRCIIFWVIFAFLGIAYADTGKLEKAISAYKKALEIDPTFEKPYNNLGNAYKKLGQNKDAISSYAKAIEVSSLSPQILPTLYVFTQVIPTLSKSLRE